MSFLFQVEAYLYDNSQQGSVALRIEKCKRIYLIALFDLQQELQQAVLQYFLFLPCLAQAFD